MIFVIYYVDVREVKFFCCFIHVNVLVSLVMHGYLTITVSLISYSQLLILLIGMGGSLFLFITSQGSISRSGFLAFSTVINNKRVAFFIYPTF